MYKKNNICFGRIIKVSFNKLIVVNNKNFIFTIPHKNITDWKKKNIVQEFKVGEKINFLIEEWSNETKTGIGNFKALHAIYARSPFEAKLQPTKHGFDNLLASVQVNLKKI
ncbi:hypothetical protein [Mycoplasmopsis columbina]|uniref:30S ribosomal protein s1 n=1 Tax=Mycoplasmopsis columbina SF7 TaxID=1037410 RepID=F9UJS9_9BACT|nr:hypothetical protein [Mycoplasmopsis columbina]EGV00275.1 30S ribosomal protein s1 [Mycoplasmopsis columbina SF7]VEU76861.1 30S ribosomal protein s1 [Mycoplasmopsis columbina]